MSAVNGEALKVAYSEPRDGVQSGRLTEIEGIRGILALIIVLYHFGLNSLVAKATGGMITSSYWENAVDFFFIISGFVLGLSQLRKPKTWAGFTVSRIFRLMPVYLFLYVIFLPFDFSEWSDRPAAYVLSIFGLAYPFGLPQWNVASWSMSLELYLPLLFAPCFLLFRDKTWIVVLGFIACFAGVAALAIDAPDMRHPYGIWRALSGLGLGLTCFFIMRAFPSIRFNAFGRFTTVICFALYLAVTLLADVLHPVGFFVPVLAVLALLSCGTSRSVLSCPPLVRLGGLTYTLYLVHLPLLSLSILAFGLEIVDGNAAFKAALVVACIIAAYGLTIFVEMPMNKVGHRLAARVSQRGLERTKDPA